MLIIHIQRGGYCWEVPWDVLIFILKGELLMQLWLGLSSLSYIHTFLSIILVSYRCRVYFYFLASWGEPIKSDRGPRRKVFKDGGGGRGGGYGGRKDDEGGRGRGRGRGVSLRIGTGKKGRQASISQRRGTLKKRDRSREKALKEERALERRTVVLSAWVIFLSFMYCFFVVWCILLH